jgi:hypothetical protein
MFKSEKLFSMKPQGVNQQTTKNKLLMLDVSPLKTNYSDEKI